MSSWKNFISRNIPAFGWTAGAFYEFNGMHIGPVFWKRNRMAIIKNDTKFYHVFFDENEPYISNTKDVIEKIDQFDEALDQQIKFVDEAINTNPAKDKSELLKLSGHHSKCFGMMLMCESLTHDLKQILEEKTIVPEEDMLYILSPIKAALTQRENRAIAASAKAYKKNKHKLKELSTDLASRFGFLHQDYMGTALNSVDYEKIIVEYKEKKEPDTHKSVLGKKYSTEEMKIIMALKKVIFLFEECRNAMVRLVWAITNSTDVHKLEREFLLNMTLDEFEQYLMHNTLKNKDKIKQRNKYFALYFDNGEYHIYSSKKEVEDLVKANNLELDDADKTNNNILKGTIANTGKAEGRVRLVFNQKDANNLEPGEVLVSSMTAVEFLAGIRKASAIITDEGGIICHAAIISRELNKPCIIGTKNATSMLNTGDFVKVDADKGIILINNPKKI